MSMGRFTGGTVILCALAASAARAEEVKGEAGPPEPPAAAAPASILERQTTVARRAALPRPDVSRSLAEDRDDPFAHLRACRTGVVRRFACLHAPHRLRSGKSGVARAEDGTLTWTLEVASPGAQAVRLHLRSFLLPPGASVVAYAADDPSQTHGPWTDAGLQDRGEFWTPPILGDVVRLELRVPASAARQPLRVVVDSVLHAYAWEAARPRQKSAQACQLDVSCDPDYATSLAKAVARLDYVSDGSGWRCTGALLNDSDSSTRVPYLLTAAHAIGSEAEAASVVCTWDYVAECGGDARSPASLPHTVGATLLVSSPETDATLLRLTGSVPGGRMYLGWTSASPAAGDAVVTLHHAAGDSMKISYGNVRTTTSSFHDVMWSRGVTEKGSSGAPLLNAMRQVVGQLYGGSSSCASPDLSDGFGRFDVSYPLLRPYLWGGDPSQPPPTSTAILVTIALPLGIWTGESLGHGESASFRLDVETPEKPRANLALRVRVNGAPGVWARITHPDGTNSFHLRGRSRIADPVSGTYPVELHAGDSDPERWLRVRVNGNW
jgi:trypsin-like peptidase